jgi:hypothetical protein
MFRKFHEFLQREPDTATEDDLRNYLLHIKSLKKWEASTRNVAHCALMFFFTKTCPRDWPTLKHLRVKQELKLPTVLSIDEVNNAQYHLRAHGIGETKPTQVRSIMSRLWRRVDMPGLRGQCVTSPNGIRYKLDCARRPDANTHFERRMVRSAKKDCT